jgi:hypothetical protein
MQHRIGDYGHKSEGFKVWDGTLAAGLSSDTGHGGETVSRNPCLERSCGSGSDYVRFPEAHWKDHFSVDKIERLDKEVRVCK